MESLSLGEQTFTSAMTYWRKLLMSAEQLIILLVSRFVHSKDAGPKLVCENAIDRMMIKTR